jgi:spermidine synthase
VTTAIVAAGRCFVVSSGAKVSRELEDAAHVHAGSTFQRYHRRMARQWAVVARWSDGGQFLDLRRRGEQFQIADDEGVLVSSEFRGRRQALASLTIGALNGAERRVLLVGLGLGDTLRAALDRLPPTATVTVCEPTPSIVDWCRSPLAEYNGNALADARVHLSERDGATVIAQSQAGRYDAILLDPFYGTKEGKHLDRLYYGDPALELVHGALWRGGAVGAWSGAPDPAFEKRLAASRFDVVVHPVDAEGSKEVIYIGRYR